MTWQHRNWYSFVWICGDQIVEQHLHNIDVCNWVMGTHPVKVVASGGAAWRPKARRCTATSTITSRPSSNTRTACACRAIAASTRAARTRTSASWSVGTKGKSNAHDLELAAGQDVRTAYRTRWQNPYVREHTAMVKSIRGEGPYINDAMTVAESTMTCIMARESAYSGLEITWDMIMNRSWICSRRRSVTTRRLPSRPLPEPGEYKFV